MISDKSIKFIVLNYKQVLLSPYSLKTKLWKIFGITMKRGYNVAEISNYKYLL